MPGETILVVDDEEADRALMRDILLREGYQILEAEDHPSAKRVFEKQYDCIQLLITDVSLPGANGCELFKSLLRDKPELRVLFVSGHVGAEVCRTYGIAMTDLYFLRKPFQPRELVSRVHAILESSGPRPEAFAVPA